MGKVYKGGARLKAYKLTTQPQKVGQTLCVLGYDAIESVQCLL